ncbi:MAG: diguanylate cyclase [Mycolicibacterium sp.]|uniref:diguanylate cyclase domain-containing protein n=1 Tax=Mycolicibacterium sp. TaxID=2320850 RepID=UPI003D0DF6C2
MSETRDSTADSWGRAALWPEGARFRGTLWLLAIFGAYVAVALLYPFTATGGVALLWLPNAVLVTALLRFRTRDWPYVYAAGLLAEVTADLPSGVAPHQALYFGVVNAVEATLVLFLAARIAGGRGNIGLLSVRGAAGVILAAVTVPALTATIGAIGSVWTFDADYFTGWRTWWFGDSLGLLVGIPIGLLLRDTARSVARRRSAPITVCSGIAAAILLLVSGALAGSGSPWGAQQTALAAAVILALAFGAVGAPTAAAMTATVTLMALAGHDGFGSAPQEQALLFVAFAAIYAIAATTESADRALGQLSRTRADLETANEWLGSLLEAAPDALVIAEADGRITMANAQTDRMFGYPREELVGSPVEMLVPPRLRDRHVRHRMHYFANPTVRTMGAGLELWGLRRDGTEFPIGISLSPLNSGQSLQVLAAIRDVTDRHEYEQRLRGQHDALMEAQQELERLARFDSLTGLVNRAEALSRLEAALECSRSPGEHLGVLFCDVDRFKAVNDTYGHAAGDVVLATLAERVCQCVRHGDTVGRTGGDELLVLLPGLHNIGEAVQIAEKIRLRAAEPIHQSGNTFGVTLSIGATLAIPGEAVVDTSSRADTAMYQAKRQGGNTVIGI